MASTILLVNDSSFETKTSAESCISRFLQTHGWDSDKSCDTSNIAPLNPSTTSELMTLEGPPEKTEEARLLAKKHGFSHRNVLGELVCAHVICRLDIGYAVCFLARFSGAPHEAHCKALRHVCKHLRATKSWGTIFQRPKPLADLPFVPFPWALEDPSLPSFPQFDRDELIGFLDAAHATELKTRRSVTGFVPLFCHAAIAWKSGVQPVVATSLTEAEFCAGATCAKAAKCLRCVLHQLEALRPGPTPLCVDNQAAIAMVNEDRPTPRARHIDIQHFAIQEWRKRGIVTLRHIPGIINPSDAATKPLGWVLHRRHVLCMMGYYGLSSM